MAVKGRQQSLHQSLWGTQAERLAFTTMAVGDKFYETDNGISYIYTGSGWVGDGSTSLELYAPDITDRPEADEVPIGTAWVVIASPVVVYLSDGTNWIEV